jgi:hypothetical protein
MSGPVKVGLAGLAIGIALAVRLLAPAGWDPSVVGAFGQDATEITTYAERRLGREVVTRDALGHDGQFYFIQGNDPWLRKPAEHAYLLDRPMYRAQRMLYPTLASLGGMAPPQTVLWGMLVVNVMLLAVGTVSTAALAVSRGASPWWGLAFVVNLGLIEALSAGSAEIVAMAAAIGGVVMLEQDRPWVAGSVLSLAVLARESMLVFVAGVVLLDVIRHRRLALGLVAPPLVIPMLWAVLLRVRMPGMSSGDIGDFLGAPLHGLARAAWQWDALDWAVLTCWAMACGILLVRGAQRPTYLSWGSVAVVALALLSSEHVWLHHYDITRTTAPVLTAWVFAAFVDTKTPMSSGLHRAFGSG